MKFLKNNLKVIIAFILGLILAGGIVYAAVSAKEVTYTTDKNVEIKNVEDALNELYELNNKNITAGNTIKGVVNSNVYTEFSKYTLSKGTYILYHVHSTVEGDVSVEINGCSESKLLIQDNNSNWEAVDWKNGRGALIAKLYLCKIDNDNTEVVIKNKKDQYSNPYVVKALTNFIKIK